MALMWVKISAVFFAAAAFALTVVERGEDSAEKIKWRPRAADEKIGEADIFSRNCQGTQRAESAQAAKSVYSLFVRL
jgi:hypothetical protein